MRCCCYTLHVFVFSIVAVSVSAKPDSAAEANAHLKDGIANKFMSLSTDALESQCEQLAKARESVNTDWMRAKGNDGTSVYNHLENLCDALKSRKPAKIQDAAQRAKKWSKDQFLHASSSASSVALGCDTLLKARNDGKGEWFEAQDWYSKTIKMCTSISGRSPQALEELMATKGASALSGMAELEDASPFGLLRSACSKLKDAPAKEQTKPLYLKTQRMCATLSDANHHRSKSESQTDKQLPSENVPHRPQRQALRKASDVSDDAIAAKPSQVPQIKKSDDPIQVTQPPVSVDPTQAPGDEALTSTAAPLVTSSAEANATSASGGGVTDPQPEEDSDTGLSPMVIFGIVVFIICGGVYGFRKLTMPKGTPPPLLADAELSEGDPVDGGAMRFLNAGAQQARQLMATDQPDGFTQF